MTHTPEPWHADIRSGCAAIYPANERDFAQGLHPSDHGRTIIVWQRGTEYHPVFHYPLVSDLDSANLRRIVACVTACAGMTDPAAELARRKMDAAKDAGWHAGYAGRAPDLPAEFCVYDVQWRRGYDAGAKERAELARLRAEVERLRKENAAWKRFIRSIIDYTDSSVFLPPTTVEQGLRRNKELYQSFLNQYEEKLHKRTKR